MSLTVWIIAVATVLIAFVGLGAGALLRQQTAKLAATGGNLVTPRLGEVLGGGEGTFGGAVVLGIVSAISFATVVAVVSGLLLNAASTIVRDLITRRPGPAGADTSSEVSRGRLASVGVGVVVVLLAIVLGRGSNATQLVTLAFGVAASANFPVLLLTLTWRRLTDLGAVVGILLGVVTSVVIMALGPLWPGHVPVISLAGPAVVAMPLALLGAVVGSLLSARRTETESFDHLLVESELGRKAPTAVL